MEDILLTLIAGPRFFINTFVPWKATGEYAENTVPPLAPKLPVNVLKARIIVKLIQCVCVW